MRSLFKFYQDTILYSVIFSIIISMVTGVLWGIISLIVIGPGIGTIIHSFLRSEELYFYYNLGYTKFSLVIKLYLLNLFLSLPILALYFYILSFIPE
ncbi:hypothetical protein [Fulvivirga sp.]|uniref:hypothetical protein n=1 Tax=Fulvivirga sp. TaxID=1931237 RepID=UPI0032F0820C